LNASEVTSQKLLAEQQKRFDEISQKLTEQMKNATGEMLKQREQEFSKSSETNLGQIVKPLQESIENMKKSMEEAKVSQAGLGASLKEQLKHAMDMSSSAKESADELARVFKHQSKLQGDWGETVLAELLESQGLEEGIHFETQGVLRDENGNRVVTENGKTLRPDVILHLDKNRVVVIDSKVSLTAFMEYVNAEDDAHREVALKAHLDSILQHVKELSEKDYSSYVQPPLVNVDYVIMFIPHTPAFLTAWQKRPTLWREAMDKHVCIASEQTLYAALQIIRMTWRQITQAENHEKVYALANEMLDRVGQFTKKYTAIGTALSAAQKAYEEGEKKLSDSGQSIPQTCSKLLKLGAKQSQKNPIPQLENTLT
jgi:DNA recombination protein RmuC